MTYEYTQVTHDSTPAKYEFSQHMGNIQTSQPKNHMCVCARNVSGHVLNMCMFASPPINSEGIEQWTLYK